MYSSRTPFGMSIQRASDDSCLRHSPTILRPKVSKRDSPSPGSLGEGSLTGRSGTMLYHLFGSSSIGSPIWAGFKSVPYVLLMACERIQRPIITASTAHHEISSL